MNKIIAAVSVLLMCVLIHSTAGDAFDVRQHLSTVTRYNVAKEISDNLFEPSNIPDQCTPIHLNLVARHGTRAPTKKKMKELEDLAAQLENFLQDAKEKKSSLEKVPGWMLEWKFPWKGKVKDGELLSQGEDELYHLGIRIRDRFPEIFEEDYHPDIYLINTTQVPRASASAVALGMGLFSGRGKLGPGNHRAFAVTSESHASDIVLRFHDCCQNYKTFKKRQEEPAVNEPEQLILDNITRSLDTHYALNFSGEIISSLWFLCKQEASLFNITDQACALFSPSEVALLEWTDDLKLFKLKGYGNSLNYRMGVKLLDDVLKAMDQAITARKEEHAPGSYEKARLRVAHAETLLPFSCLLGLFLEGSEFELMLKGQPLPLPPKPPQKRNWRGSMVAPFAGNNMLVLYACPDSSSKYFVQVLHNERPVPMPGCNNSDFCPYDVFKDKIVGPHLEHNYYDLCNSTSKESDQKKPEVANIAATSEESDQKEPEVANTTSEESDQKEPEVASSKLCRIFSWFFSCKENNITRSGKDEL